MKFLLCIVFSGMLYAQSFQHSLDRYMAHQLTGYAGYSYTIASESVQKPGDVWNIDTSKSLRIAKGYGYVPVIISKQNGSQVAALLTLRMKLQRGVLVALRNIKPGEVLSSADFSLSVEEISGLNDTPVFNPVDLSESVSKIHIRQGNIVTERMLRKKPDVMFGDLITAYKTIGAITVTITAESRGEGTVGERIKIKSEDNKFFTAVIESSSQVKIIE